MNPQIETRLNELKKEYETKLKQFNETGIEVRELKRQIKYFERLQAAEGV